MPGKTCSIIEIRDVLPHLPEYFAQEPNAVVAVTHYNQPVMAILSWDMYESLIETLEVLSAAELMTAFRQAVQELAEGKGRPWKDVKEGPGQD